MSIIEDLKNVKFSAVLSIKNKDGGMATAGVVKRQLDNIIHDVEHIISENKKLLAENASLKEELEKKETLIKDQSDELMEQDEKLIKLRKDRHFKARAEAAESVNDELHEKIKSLKHSGDMLRELERMLNNGYDLSYDRLAKEYAFGCKYEDAEKRITGKTLEQAISQTVIGKEKN